MIFCFPPLCTLFVCACTWSRYLATSCEVPSFHSLHLSHDTRTIKKEKIRAKEKVFKGHHQICFYNLFPSFSPKVSSDSVIPHNHLLLVLAERIIRVFFLFFFEGAITFAAFSH